MGLEEASVRARAPVRVPARTVEGFTRIETVICAMDRGGTRRRPMASAHLAFAGTTFKEQIVYIYIYMKKSSLHLQQPLCVPVTHTRL